MSIGATSSEVLGSGIIDVKDNLELEPILQSVEIIGIREGGYVDCWVPVDLIDREEVPVDEAWVQSLARQMDAMAAEDGEGNGQATPVTLGLIQGEPTLKIIDGFHRDAVIHARGEKQIYATVKRVDWEGLFDFRILTAKDHAHVRFSRVVQWIEQAWQCSGLSDKLTVEQAVLLYRFDTSGVRHGLEEAEVQVAKNWVARKEGQWEIAAMTMHNYLTIAATVDPSLVHKTREKKSSHALEAPTQSIIKIFSVELPNNFELQNLVMDAAKKNNLPGPKTTALCQSVKGMNLEEATNFIGQIDWETWEPVYRATTKKVLRQAHDPRTKGGLVLSSAIKEVEQIFERVSLSLERNEAITPEMDANIASAQERVTHMYRSLGRLKISLDELRETGAVRRDSEATAPTPVRSVSIKSEDEQVTPRTLTITETKEDVAETETLVDIPETPDKITRDNTLIKTAEVVDTAVIDDALPPTNISDFRSETRDGFVGYLEGRIRTMPRLKTRVQITAAEEVLERGGFKTRKLVTELENAIQEAKDRHVR